MDKKCHISTKVETLLEMFPAVAVISSRQCGKSTLGTNYLTTDAITNYAGFL